MVVARGAWDGGGALCLPLIKEDQPPCLSDLSWPCSSTTSVGLSDQGLSPMPDDLVPALFALATVIAEHIHDTTIAGQDAGLEPRKVEELAQRLRRHAADLDALGKVVGVAVASSDLTADHHP